MTYNPPYYARLLENYGFRKTQDLYAFWGHIDMLPKISAKLGPVAEQIIERYNVRLRSMDIVALPGGGARRSSRSTTARWRTPGDSCRCPRARWTHMAAGLRHLIVPELAIVTEVDGQVVGATFGLPDYNPRIRQIDGRLFPFGLSASCSARTASSGSASSRPTSFPSTSCWAWAWCWSAASFPRCWRRGCKRRSFPGCWNPIRSPAGPCRRAAPKLTKTYRLYDLDPPPGRGMAAEDGQPGPAAAAAAGSRWRFAPCRPAATSDQFIQVPCADLRRRSALGAAAGDGQ